MGSARGRSHFQHHRIQKIFELDGTCGGRLEKNRHPPRRRPFDRQRQAPAPTVGGHRRSSTLAWNLRDIQEVGEAERRWERWQRRRRRDGPAAASSDRRVTTGRIARSGVRPHHIAELSTVPDAPPGAELECRGPTPVVVDTTTSDATYGPAAGLFAELP